MEMGKSRREHCGKRLLLIINKLICFMESIYLHAYFIDKKDILS